MILEQFLPVTKAMRPGNHVPKLKVTLGSNLVDVIPSLEKLPQSLHWWHKRGVQLFNNTLETYRIPWYVRLGFHLTIRNKLIADMENGDVKSCFAAHIYENRREYGLTDDEAMFAGDAAT